MFSIQQGMKTGITMCLALYGRMKYVVYSQKQSYEPGLLLSYCTGETKPVFSKITQIVWNSKNFKPDILMSNYK